jgi:hypothetical protein
LVEIYMRSTNGFGDIISNLKTREIYPALMP